VDMGVPSLSWDQYFIEPPEPNVLSLTRQIREHSRRRDPQSTFSAEEINAMDVSCDYLDFTWNWDMARDCQPATSVFPSPRINWNIDTSVLETKTAFVQNRYLNVQPRKPDGTNGSDRIASHPELSRALKQCAKLRGQFLPYFVEGTLVGDCVLVEPCPDAVVGAYALRGVGGAGVSPVLRPGHGQDARATQPAAGGKSTPLVPSILVIVLNIGPRRAIELNCDLGPWMPPGAGGYEVRCLDGAGGLVRAAASAQASVRLITDPLEPLGIALFEVVRR